MKAALLLVVPAYNEERRLDAAAFVAFLAAAPDAGFVFVDDGSTDGTGSLLRDLASTHDRVTVLSLGANGGKAEAVRQGMLAALALEPEFVGYWDADLATPLPASLELRDELRRWPATVLVMGSRVRLMGRLIDRRSGRHYLGRIFATAVSLVLGVAVYDTQCGAKLFRVDPALKECLEEPFGSRWIFDVELLARVLDRLGRDTPADALVREFPLAQWADRTDSRLSLMDFVRAPMELWRIHRRRRQRTMAARPPIRGQNMPTRAR